jgi:hypothetical protein
MKLNKLIERLDLPISGYFIYNRNISEDEEIKVQGPFKNSELAWESLLNMNNPTNFVIGKFDKSCFPVEEEIFERYLEDNEVIDEETEMDESSKTEIKIKGGKRAAVKKYSGNKGDAEDRNYRVVNGKKQFKKNAKREHDNKKNSASDRWKNMSSRDKKQISKSIKKSMEKADKLHNNRGDKNGPGNSAERLKKAAEIIAAKKKKING